MKGLTFVEAREKIIECIESTIQSYTDRNNDNTTSIGIKRIYLFILPLIALLLMIYESNTINTNYHDYESHKNYKLLILSLLLFIIMCVNMRLMYCSSGGSISKKGPTSGKLGKCSNNIDNTCVYCNAVV